MFASLKCEIHQENGEAFNQRGEVICRLCLLQQNQDVEEYQEKKKTILKKQQEQILERLKISKKRMIEVQETLQKNMDINIASLESHRQNLLSYFADQEKKIDNFSNQQQDYQVYLSNNKLVTNQDSQSRQVVILGERIQVLEEEFQQLLEQSITLYTGLVYQKQSSVQKVEEKQEQIQQQVNQEQFQQFQQFQYNNFHVFQKVNIDEGVMQINKNNNMIAYSESFEITILTFENQLVQFDVDKIEEEDMAIIQCLKFGNKNDDLYFGTNNGTVRIWRKVDQKWDELQKIDSNQVEILDLLLNSNDTSLFTAGKDKSVQLRKKNGLGEWILNRSFNHNDIGSLTSIAINLNETTLVVSSFTQIKIWKLDNDSDQFQIIDGIEPDRHNVIQFINNKLFYLHSPQANKFYENNNETHFILTQNPLPDEFKITNFISYCQQMSIMIVQNQNKNVFTLKYNDDTKLFQQVNQIQGEYDSIQIAQNAQYLLLYKKNEKNLYLLKRN